MRTIPRISVENQAATTASSAGTSGTEAVTVNVCTVFELMLDIVRETMTTGQHSTGAPDAGTTSG